MNYFWFFLGVAMLSCSVYNTELVVENGGVMGAVILNTFLAVMVLAAGWNVLPPAKEID